MIEILTEVDYKISLYPSKFLGYQSKSKNQGYIKLFIPSIWDWVNTWSDNYENIFENFNSAIIYITLLERICLERAFQKIRMTKRCEDYNGFSCKMDYIACLIAKNLLKNKEVD